MDYDKEIVDEMMLVLKVPVHEPGKGTTGNICTDFMKKDLFTIQEVEKISNRNRRRQETSKRTFQ